MNNASGPAVTALNPTHGPAAGGNTVTITGTDLTGATAVNFGANAATAFTVDNATTITATAPAVPAGSTVDVTVTTPAGTSPTAGTGNDYTYVGVTPAPTEGPRPPYYQRPWFQGTAAVVALLTAVWAFVGAPKLWDTFADLFSSELPRVNAEIVFDASVGMNARFGAGSHQKKIEAAADAVGIYGLPLSNEGLALRRVGGRCRHPGPQLVDFGANHGDDVANVAAEQRAGGKSNLAATVIAAIDDFADFPPKAPKQLVIFAGTADDCQTGAIRVIHDRIEESHINADFQLIGVKLSQADQEYLRQLQQALGGKNVHVHFASTTTDLEQAVDDADDAAMKLSDNTNPTPTVGN